MMLFTKRWAKIAVAIIALVIAASFVIATMASATPVNPTSALGVHITQGATKTRFLSLLNALRLDNRPSRHGGYARSLFKVWGDGNGDGCNTRSDVLRSESSGRVTTGSNGCTVKTGRWWSAYDNIWFTVASRLDIDHFVPLSEAWKSGAYAWSKSRRDAYANDEGYGPSLIAVSASTNRAKSDADPANWLPPNYSYWCTYAASWVGVKYRWSLTIDWAEKVKLRALLMTCGGSVPVPLPSKA